MAASALLRSVNVVTLIGVAMSPPVVVSTETVPLPMPGTVAHPMSGLAGGGASQDGGISPLPGPVAVIPASDGGQSPKGSSVLLADMVDGAAAEKHAEKHRANASEKQTVLGSSPGHPHRDREHTTIQSRAVTVGLECSATGRTAHTGASLSAL
jgi:hypothetical protein